MRATLFPLFFVCLSVLPMFTVQAETVTFDLSRAGENSLDAASPSSLIYGLSTFSNGAISLSVTSSEQQDSYLRCLDYSAVNISMCVNARFSGIVITKVRFDFAKGYRIDNHVYSSSPYSIEYDDIDVSSFQLKLNESHGMIDISQITVTFDPEVTVGATGYASLYLNDAANIPAGVNVYTTELSGEKVMLHPVEGTIIPAKTGVILQNQGTFSFTQASEAGSPVSGNSLVGSTTKQYAEDYPGTLYALGIKNEVLGFYRLNLDTNTGQTPITSYKSYLLVDAGSSKPSAITFTDEVLGIHSVSSQETIGLTYDLQGRLLQNQPQRASLQKGNVVIR